MKKITLLLAGLLALSCSGDDNNGSTAKKKHYSAHMKTECPSNSDTPIYDVCVSKAVWDYLGEYRDQVGVNNCCYVTFEALDGQVYEDYLIRVELNMYDCSEFEDQ